MVRGWETKLTGRAHLNQGEDLQNLAIRVREREEQVKGREDISPALADWALVFHSCVACQLSKNGKAKSKTFLMWPIRRSPSKSSFQANDNHYNGNYVKIPYCNGLPK